MASLPNTERFTGRAEAYARFRPGYPEAVIDLLRAEAGWTPDAVVADIGAGTGISTEYFLRHGNAVWAVEPNQSMREAAATLRRQYPKLEVVDGTAEASTLPDECVDLVVAATAFHWFDAAATRTEFLRILKPRGQAVLMWNKRVAESSPFLGAYEDLLLRFGTDYQERWAKDRHEIAERIAGFFGAARFREASFANPQPLDLEGLMGRLLSASYAPLPGHPNHEPMMAEAREVFAAHQQDGHITFEYRTVVYWGRPALP